MVLCKPGDYVPGIDVTLSVGKIRGVESHGMMASERELELSDEHNGIIELPSGEIGQRFTDWLAENDPAKVDPVIDIAITPNRPDALGVRGIARDLAARGLGTLKPAPEAHVEGRFDSPISVSIDADTLDDAPLFMGRLIRGVRNGPSPQWLQDRLRAIGKGGETLVGLDEKDYEFPAGAVVISDDHQVESIAGIMGGLRTGCSDETTNVFLEAAVWDAIQIARTGRALKINSDARYRYERGIDPLFNAPALELATQMILDLCGGEPSHVVSAGAVPDVARAYKLDTDRVVSLVGMEIPAETRPSARRWKTWGSPWTATWPMCPAGART